MPTSAQKAPEKSQPSPALHFTDVTAAAGIRYLGWGIGCVDLDNDGWHDLFAVNGHVYPQVDVVQAGAKYRQREMTEEVRQQLQRFVQSLIVSTA